MLTIVAIWMYIENICFQKSSWSFPIPLKVTTLKQDMILFSIIQCIQMSWKIIIGLFWVNSATVHTRRLLPFLRDVLISLVKKARRAIDTWCMFSSSASLAFTAVIMHFRRLLLPLSRPWFWPRFTRKNRKVRI